MTLSSLVQSCNDIFLALEQSTQTARLFRVRSVLRVQNCVIYLSINAGDQMSLT